jgi:glycosyltransferase involved in cell wall biosynthesis
MISMNKLAIVIPSYHNLLLDSALTCLAKQTVKNFNVYIGDDCSKMDLTKIVRKYDDLNITYKRFNENMGQNDLVGQWNRTVRLSDEKWVWLFSDDDIADSKCVEYFYNSLDETKEKYSLYRFNTLLINETGEIVDVSPSHATLETPMEYALYRLQGNRHGCISNIIFSRESFDRENGFINFPFGWYADDASIIAFSGQKNIYTILGPRVKYMLPWSDNMSSKKSFLKIKALFQYNDWLNNRFSDLSQPDIGLNIDLLNKISKRWFFDNFIALDGLPYRKILLVSKKLDKIFNNGLARNFIKLIFLNLYTSLKGVARFIK